MTIDRHRRAKEIFLVACELQGDERVAYVDSSCGDDSELRREVAELLSFHEDAGTDLPSSPIAAVARSSRDDLETITGFRLIQIVGEGGMGEVYEAEQVEPVRRRVALKVIKWGMDTKEVVARFESERQALALMNHANIARVFEAGATEQGRPYFAMEYVKGVPITAYCDTHRLTTRERLDLFVQVCHGVQHAHQKGVIHRDMKPSNVLVTIEDNRPVPKIIDFGVAKATSQRLTERTVFTELGQWIGTPEYMSPEQAEMSGLDIDTRTDVYSLGVILYELLVGAQPFDSTTLRSAGFDEMRRRIREDEPPRPSTKLSSQGDDSDVAASRRRIDLSGLVREVKGDLDWIVMKALEKDRTRRYSSALELAADVERHLGDQPVLASPPSAVYRLGKFVRRHRVAVAAAALIVAALVAGIAGTAIGLLRAQREAESARQVADFLEGMFQELDPETIGPTVSTPEMMLDRSLARIDEELGGQPLVQARLLHTLGGVYIVFGRYDRAGPTLERALEIRRRELGADHPDVATALGALAWFRYTVGDYPESLRLNEEALSILERAYGPDHPRMANSLRTLGKVHWMIGDYEQSRVELDRALSILEDHPEAGSHRLATTLFWRAILATEIGDDATGKRYFERALALRREALGPDHPSTAWVEHDFGRLLHRMGDFERSERMLRHCLEVFTATYGQDNPALAFPLADLAELMRTTGRRDEARPLYERALELRTRYLGPDHVEVMWTTTGYGWLEYNSENYRRALELFERSLEIARRSLPAGHQAAGWARMGIGASLHKLGDAEGARSELEHAVANLEQVYGDRPAVVAWPHHHLGKHFLESNDLERARPSLERAATIRDAAVGPSHPDLAVDLMMLAVLESRSDNPEVAEGLFERALRISEETRREDDPFTGTIRREYAVHLRSVGRPDRARAVESTGAD